MIAPIFYGRPEGGGNVLGVAPALASWDKPDSPGQVRSAAFVAGGQRGRGRAAVRHPGSTRAAPGHRAAATCAAARPQRSRQLSVSADPQADHSHQPAVLDGVGDQAARCDIVGRDVSGPHYRRSRRDVLGPGTDDRVGRLRRLQAADPRSGRRRADPAPRVLSPSNLRLLPDPAVLGRICGRPRSMHSARSSDTNPARASGTHVTDVSPTWRCTAPSTKQLATR